MSKFNKSHLRAIIRESIKEIITESQNRCKQWQSAHPSFYRSFTNGCCGPQGCNTINESCYSYAVSSYKYTDDPCECGDYGSGINESIIKEQTPQQCAQLSGMTNFGMCCENATGAIGSRAWHENECKDILNAAMGMGLTIQQLENCCPNNNRPSPGDCDDPLWVSMPMNSSTNKGKLHYCKRCTETGGGNPTAGSNPADLFPSGPDYWQTNTSGLDYCHCCVPEGCETPTIQVGDPDWPMCLECFGAQPAAAPAGVAAITGPHCSCCRPDDRSGRQCDLSGSYRGGPGDYNDNWGLNCWFCHPERGPGCTEITTGMDQWNAWQAFQAGQTIHPTEPPCNADPNNECGDDPHDGTQCHCCKAGNASNMFVMPGPNLYQDCTTLDGTIASHPGLYNCTSTAVSPNCKGTPTGPTGPLDQPTGPAEPDMPISIAEEITMMQKRAGIIK